MEQSSEKYSTAKKLSEWLSILYSKWSLVRYQCSGCERTVFKLRFPGDLLDTNPIERIYYTAPRCAYGCLDNGGYTLIVSSHVGAEAEKEAIKICKEIANART